MLTRTIQTALIAMLSALFVVADVGEAEQESLLQTISARQAVATGILPDGLVPYPQVLREFKEAYDIPIGVEHAVTPIPGAPPGKDLRTVTGIAEEMLATRLPPDAQRLDLLRGFEATRHIAFTVHGGTTLAKNLDALNEAMDNAFAWKETGGMVFVYPRDYGPGSPSAALDTRITLDVVDSAPWEAFVALEDAYHATGAGIPIFFDMPCMGAYVMIRGWLDRPFDEFLHDKTISLKLENAPLREAIGMLCQLTGRGRSYHLSLDARASNSHPAPTLNTRGETWKPFGQYIDIRLVFMEAGRPSCVRMNPAPAGAHDAFFAEWDPIRQRRAARLAERIAAVDRTP